MSEVGHGPEDIVFCVDLDSEIDLELKPSSGKGSSSAVGLTRLNVVKQAMILFYHAKLQMDPRHQFAIMAVTDKPSWVCPMEIKGYEFVFSFILGLF